VAGAIQLTEVDFDQIKQNLVNYLKSTNKFTDFDFDGSNLQVILNMLAYQAQINAYSTNMIANESFLSSATIRQNVASNAAMIGYVPTSARCASTYITFEFTLERDEYTSGFPTYLELQRGAAFSVSNNSQQLIFNFADTQTAVVNNFGACTFTNVKVYEGVFLSATFTRDESDYNQKFILKNQNIDTTTIRVEVQEDPNEDINTLYTRAENLVELEDDSRVYWISETEEGYYELTFGDDYFGKKLKNGARIYIDYIVSNGELSNGIQGLNNFKYIGKTVDSYGTTVTTKPSVFSAEKTQGGQDIESVPSVKFRAPKFYEAQNRCVVGSDYSALVRNIYPAVDDIYVYGGEQKEIPQYGRVFVVVKPNYADKLSSLVKNFIKKSLDNYRVASLDIVLEDPQVLNIEVISTVYYDDTKTLKDASAIVSDVKNTLSKFSESPNIEKFGGSVRFSRVVGSIDDSDPSITRNLTQLRMRRDIKIVPNTSASYEICFENELPQDPLNSVVYSSGFKLVIDGVLDTKTYFMRDVNDIEDPTKGKMILFYLDEFNKEVVVNKDFGIVDYVKGEVLVGYQKPIKIYDTELSDYTVEVRAYPKEVDVVAKQFIYLNFDVAKSVISAVEDSGN
jgi:hypothetical protein